MNYWKMYKILPFLLLLPFALLSKNNDFPYIAKKTTGVTRFLEEHPTYDGRGILLIIVDSGVDMGIEGLKKTSTNEVKVIDVMDFSGEGDFYFSPVIVDTTERGNRVFSIQNKIVYGVETILQEADSSKIMGGIISEYHYLGSSLSDLNRDGDSDDEFPFIVYQLKNKNEKVVRIDLNGDGHFEDEKKYHDYWENNEYFSFVDPTQNEKNTPFHFAVKILWGKNKLVLFTDGAGHGTHVAGIASGYNIYGQKNYNGIAPGAKIIACKIGDSRKSGGASTTGSMKKAFEYGLKKAKELNMPVVFNMSYGVGSELEGNADLERFLNDFLLKNREAVICLSNGNSGPGISSSGMPAVAWRAISSGALFAKENALSSYGVGLKRDKIFHFSSRGGEMMKPDLVAPGSASSTVPEFLYGDRMWGTSMASPHTAGIVALLMSAAKQENLPIVNSLIKRALINSAKWLDEYELYDQGGGLIQVDKAFSIYKKLVSRIEKNLPIEYKIINAHLIQNNSQANSFLWEYGPLNQANINRIVVNVYPQYLSNKEKAYESYHIFSSVPWLKLERKYAYTKKGNSFSIPVTIDKSLLVKSGIYSGKLYGIRQGESKSKENVLFESWFTVVVPQILSSKNDYQVKIKEKNLSPGNIQRHFVLVTSDMQQLLITLQGENPSANCRFYVFDPKGRRVYNSPFVTGNERYSWSISGENIHSGTYEIDVFTNYSSKHKTDYELTIQGRGYSLENSIVDLHYDEHPHFLLTLNNNIPYFLDGRMEGMLYGLSRNIREKIKGADSYSYRLHIPENCSSLSLKVHLPVEDFNKMTDFSVIITDEAGTEVYNTSLDFSEEEIFLSVQPGGTYYLEFYSAFFDPEVYSMEWNLDMGIKLYFKNPIIMDIQNSYNGSRFFSLTPYTPHFLKCVLKDVPSILPDDYIFWGKIQFKENYFGNVVPIEFYVK